MSRFTKTYKGMVGKWNVKDKDHRHDFVEVLNVLLLLDILEAVAEELFVDPVELLVC